MKYPRWVAAMGLLGLGPVNTKRIEFSLYSGGDICKDSFDPEGIERS